MTIEDFQLPFGGQLAAENRWVKLSKLMPWDMVEDIYAEKFKMKSLTGGAPSLRGSPLARCIFKHLSASQTKKRWRTSARIHICNIFSGCMSTKTSRCSTRP